MRDLTPEEKYGNITLELFKEVLLILVLKNKVNIRISEYSVYPAGSEVCIPRMSSGLPKILSEALSHKPELWPIDNIRFVLNTWVIICRWNFGNLR